ncbi:hypothetical protein [uncultured Tateyamaria sp.]|nr:hypothetical protein [uncultured Tateyamaria sp.]
MAEHRGACSNHWDEFFTELERWEALLSTLPDFPVDGAVRDADPPD